MYLVVSSRLLFLFGDFFYLIFKHTIHTFSYFLSDFTVSVWHCVASVII